MNSRNIQDRKISGVLSRIDIIILAILKNNFV